MKRRLRKKKHLGEFREDCFELGFVYDSPLSPAEDAAFWDEFIVGFIEACGLQFGGGGDPHGWTGVVAKSGPGTISPEERQTVIDWLEQHPRVTRVSAGPLRDAWHGW